MRAKHIGIVGCSAEGAALCYRTICSEGSRYLGEHGHPEVSMHTYSLAEYMECIDRDDWGGVGELMQRSAEKLATIGAELLICPDNTIHKALSSFRSPLPWLHIADVVADEALRRGFRKVGLTGTKYLVESDVYPSRLSQRGIEFEMPPPADRMEINRIIFEELVQGRFTDQSVATFQSVIERLKVEGCEAVVLGCTEIPLLMNDANSPLPTLDSTRLLARAAVAEAVRS